MASGATHSDPKPPPVQVPTAPRQPSRHEQAIGTQLNRTGRQVKTVDLGVGLLVLAAGVLGFLMLSAVVDHWLLPMNSAARWLAFVLLAAGSLWWIVARLLPLAIRKVNPLYAAHTLEAAEPSLKNSLINFLMLRQQGHVRPVILQGIEVHAARGLTNPTIETAVDRSKMIRVASVLIAIMVAATAYLFISPKSPLSSFARVVAPWSDIAPPTRVVIQDVEPGDTTVFLGNSVEISALVKGHRDEEPVHLVYRTVDGAIENARLPMTVTEGDPRFRASLPPQGGVRQEMYYRLECGDAASPEFFIAVEQAPSIVVEQVEYHPPAYTGRAKRTVEGEGDLSGLEGAEVVLHAVANREMQLAQLQFDPESNSAAVGQKLAMQIDGRHATVRFKLRLTADRRTPWHTSYQLFFETPEGESSQQGIRHTIKVLPDLPPEIEVLEPEQRDIQVPVNAAVELKVRAIDPDFGLSRMWLTIDARGQLLREEPLWDAAGSESLPQLVETYRFVPAQMELQEGDVAIVVAHAADNRHSPVSGSLEPSTARTPNYRITVIAPVDGQPQNEQSTGGDEGEDEEQNSGEGEGQDDHERPSIPDGDPTRGDQEEPQAGSDTQESQEQQENAENQDNDQADGTGGLGGGSSDSAEGESEDSESGSGGSGGSSSAEGEEGGEQQGEPVASDGSADGQAIERVAQQLRDAATPPSSSDSSPPEGDQGDQTQQPGEQNDSSQAGDESQNSTSEGGGSSSAADRLEQIAENFEQLNDQQSGDDQQPAGGTQGGPQQQRPEPGSREARDRAERVEELTDQLRDLKDQIDRGEGGEDIDRTREAMERIEEQVREQQERGGESLEESELTAEEQELAEALEDLEQSLENQAAQESTQTAEQGSQEGAGGDSEGERQGGEEATSEQSASGQEEDAGEPSSAGREEGSQEAGTGNERSDAEQPSGAEPSVGSSQAEGAGTAESEDSGGPENSTESQEQGTGGETPEEDNNAGSDSTQRPQSTTNEGETTPNETEGSGSSSVSDHQSDHETQGQDGSHSGQGGQGSGEQSSQAGHDTPGSNSPSDEGAGAANERGEGEAGSEGGEGEESADPTGSAGDETGDGSTSRDSSGSESGEGEPQQNSGEQQPGDSQEQPQDEGQAGGDSAGEAGENESESPSGQDRQGQPGSSRQAQGGGGVTSSGDLPPGHRMPEEEAVEQSMEANLEYARETTDLVLEYLRDQEHDPDEELLKELGWTPEQLRDFIQRMEQRRNQAAGTDEAQQDYEEFLSSLGLVPPEAATRREEAGGQDYTQADTGTHSEAPNEYYQRMLPAYGRALNRAGE